METALMELAAAETEYQVTAFDVGVWCFHHDMECPYTDDRQVAEWHLGWCDAAEKVLP